MIQLLPCKNKSASSPQARGIWGRIVLFFLLSVFTTFNSYALPTLAPSPTTSAKKIKVLSTIKPIQLLVNQIVGEHAEPVLLIPATMSLHHYSLRPSDLRKLSHADVVIRISEHMETFLNPLFSSSQSDKLIITLSEIPKIKWLTIRGKHDHGSQPSQQSNHDAHNHGEHTDEDADHHGDKGARYDYHFWLDPHHVELMVNHITEQLINFDSAHGDDYKKNSQLLIQQIRDANQVARLKLQPFKNSPYLVFHDGWHYLEQAYGLDKPHVISLQEGLPPGLKTLYKLRQEIREEKINCLIASPNSNKRVIKTLTEKLPVKVVWLSPNAATDKETSINDYPAFIQHNAEQFSQCLGATP